MEKEIINTIWRAMDRLRGSVPSRDIVYVLIELLALKARAEKSPEFNQEWKMIVNGSDDQEYWKNSIIKLYSEYNFETSYLNRLFRDSKSEYRLKDLLQHIDNLSIGDAGYEIAWQLITYSNKNKGKFEQVSISRELSELVVNLLDIRPDDSAYCLGELAVGASLELNNKCNEIRVHTQYVNFILDMLLCIANVDAEVIHASYHDEDEFDTKKFNKAFTIPPWNAKFRKDNHVGMRHAPYKIVPTSYESYFIQKSLFHTSEKTVAILSPGFLFKTAGTDHELKKYLVENNLIETVIKLPSRVFPSTSVTPVLVVFNKSIKNEEILFFDARGEGFSDDSERHYIKLKNIESIIKTVSERKDTDITRLVSKQEIVSNEYNLDVNRYVLSEKEQNLYIALQSENTVNLEDLVDFFRAQAIKSQEEGIEVKEANPADIENTGFIEEPKKRIFFSGADFNTYAKQKLHPNDIVLAIKGSVGRVGMIPEDFKGDWIAGQSYVILRLKNGSKITDPIVLYRYLASDLAQSQLLSKAAGATVKLIKMNDVKSMRVIVPSLEEQKEIVNNQREIESLYEQIDKTQEKIDKLRSAYWSA